MTRCNNNIIGNLNSQISHIHSESPLKGILCPGDSIFSVNGRQVRDIIDFIYLSYPGKITIEYQSKKNENRLKKVTLRKEEGSGLGIDFENSIFDKIKICNNKCVFCFVDQMAPELRKSLYLKDDDYRLSFLEGNFVTLTNLNGNDWKKLIKYRLSPLYISVHSTQPEVRRKLFGKKDVFDIKSLLKKLSENHICFHVQIVLCPGINDGKNLIRTLNDLIVFFPNILSIGIVPAGRTKYCKNDIIRSFTHEESMDICDKIGKFRKKYLKKYGTALLYPADEFFIKAGIEIPGEEYYEEYPQLENGIGMIRLFEESFAKGIKDFKIQKNPVKKKFLLVTGRLFKPFLKRLVSDKRLKDLNIQVLGIDSEFWGKEVTVTGLLTGHDIISALQKKYEEYIIFIPEVCMTRGYFLDELHKKNIKNKFKNIHFIKGDSESLISSLRKELSDKSERFKR